MTDAYPTLACPACGEPMEPRDTHAGKPVYHCDPCGTQIFVRREEGIQRLKDRRGGRRSAGGWPWGREP
jgi:DNA-directed RNA polymerase subunit RPC12/RpoP